MFSTNLDSSLKETLESIAYRAPPGFPVLFLKVVRCKVTVEKSALIAPPPLLSQAPEAVQELLDPPPPELPFVSCKSAMFKDALLTRKNRVAPFPSAIASSDPTPVMLKVDPFVTVIVSSTSTRPRHRAWNVPPPEQLVIFARVFAPWLSFTVKYWDVVEHARSSPLTPVLPPLNSHVAQAINNPPCWMMAMPATMPDVKLTPMAQGE